MLSFPNAKINIGLYITEKRPDGFHNLESCFYPVPWSDGLEIIPSNEVKCTSSGLPVPGDPEQNLCLKAYRLLQGRFSLPPVHIHLHKVLPMGAGLGGGSADAAHVIKLLNRIFDIGLPQEEQELLAAELGSDCAFFIRNKPVFASGKGAEFSRIELDLSGYFLVIVHPGLHIGTAEAYRKIKPKPALHDLRKQLQMPIETWKNVVKNDFEEALFPDYPQLPKLKESLYQSGALYASMSGSGSAVFGLFAKREEIQLRLPEGYLVWKGLL